MTSLLSRYWHTLRHLKLGQFYGRLLFKLSKPRPDFRPAPPLRPLAGSWACPVERASSLSGESVFRFLNEEHDLAALQGWDDAAISKLWRYNLHYHDTLNATGAAARRALHRRLLGSWIDDNPPGRGSGWEPYPTSLRIVNWIKWALAGNALAPKELASLAIQARWLSGRLEIHLLGNHLFANAKALVFAGLFFSGPEAQRWLTTGARILAREIPEQILSDGGQFERSPMYHALALEDMLDLCNVARAFAAERGAGARWPEMIGPMRTWLAAMSHPDRQIAFFNDAAFGVAASAEALERYADTLGFPSAPAPTQGMHLLADSGYIRMQHGDAVALLDVGPIGPDYLPGHAHADTLSFELSLFGQRTFVNSGTSQYGLDAERQRQRATPAHNTVTVDRQDSSEVWSGFRVARRARPLQLQIDERGAALAVSCAHDGYRRLPGNNMHRRSWLCGPDYLELADDISGSFGQAEARFHLHPDVVVESSDGPGHCRLRLPGGQAVEFSTDGGDLEVQSSTWHPYFGVTLDNACLVLRFSSKAVKTRISWLPGPAR